MRSQLPDFIRQFVETVESLRDADMSFRDDPDEPALPPCAAEPGLSRYLLLAASIDAQTDSRGIRRMLHRLDGALREDGHKRGLFDLAPAHTALVDGCVRLEPLLRGWRLRSVTPQTLIAANAFAEADTDGDLDAWAADFDHPGEIVDVMAAKIPGLGRVRREGTRKRLWMLMRWLGREAPDLHRWTHLSPAELMVPVDGHVANFAFTFNVLPMKPKNGPTWRDVDVITDFARGLWPGDPARVDYPFFMWSRSQRLAAQGRGGRDTCVALFRGMRRACPLHDVRPCCSRCPG